MLPLLSGLEVLRQLRAHSDTRDIPVIMLTAKGEEKQTGCAGLMAGRMII